MLTPTKENHGTLAELRRAALDNRPVAGLTHRHYKYPARFSPTFVAAAIDAFSEPGDLILDPYMGGGTTIVEAWASGRRAVGSDLNSLAVFVARTKTIRLSQEDEYELTNWAIKTVPSLSYFDSDPRISEALCEKRTKNLHLPRARPIKKFIALALVSLDTLSSSTAQEFARCVLLNSAQWALNGKKRKVSLGEFRLRVTQTTLEMLNGSAALAKAVADSDLRTAPPALIHDSAENLANHRPFSDGERANLVITSPPYPGVHVLYHRWQVDGRRETPAPYWIANCLDGQGEAYYGFGARREQSADSYFAQSLKTLKSIRSVMHNGAIMVQMIAFSDPLAQLKRYLGNMEEAGFCELRDKAGRPIRTWRDVPGRSWHASLQGETTGAREVALLHIAA